MAVAGAWATIQDVEDYTGAEVTQAQINQAQTMIEALIKRVWRDSDEDTSAFYWLSRAVAWQARYVKEHPADVGAVGISSLSQDGFAVTYAGAGPGAGSRSYSSEALRALNNLYRGANTTIRLNSAFQGSRRSRPRLFLWR